MKRIEEMTKNVELIEDAGYIVIGDRIYDANNYKRLQQRYVPNFNLTIYEKGNNQKILFKPFNDQVFIHINSSLSIENIEHDNNLETIAIIDLGNTNIHQIIITLNQEHGFNHLFVHFEKLIQSFSRENEYEEYGKTLCIYKKIGTQTIMMEIGKEIEEISGLNSEELYNLIISHINENKEFKDNESVRTAINIMSRTIYAYIEKMLIKSKIRQK